MIRMLTHDINKPVHGMQPTSTTPTSLGWAIGGPSTASRGSSV
jgi:hypothetical protein